MKRRRFSREDKLAALGPLLAGELGVTEQARQLGLGRTVLQRWLAEYQARGAEAFPGSGPPADELSRLRRQLAEVTRERDILKKAQAYFNLDRP